MPRLRSDHTQTVRVELGVRERQYVEAAGTVAAVSIAASAAGIALAGAGAGLAGYALYQWLKEGLFDDILPVIGRASKVYRKLWQVGPLGIFDALIDEQFD